MRLFIVLIMFFVSSDSLGQEVTSRLFYTRNGFCGNSIIINSNQTYTEEGGCENRSNVHYGRWQKLNDTMLQLLPNDIDIVNSVSYQNDTTKHECKMVKFKVVDVIGEPIYSFDIILYKKAVQTNNSRNRFINNPAYTGEQIFETDDNGFLEINYSSFDSVAFSSLEPYLNTKVKYALEDMEGKLVTLKLNANAIAFAYSEVKFFKKEKPTIIRFRRKSIAVDDSNETWILNEN